MNRRKIIRHSKFKAVLQQNIAHERWLSALVEVMHPSNFTKNTQFNRKKVCSLKRLLRFISISSFFALLFIYFCFSFLFFHCFSFIRSTKRYKVTLFEEKNQFFACNSKVKLTPSSVYFTDIKSLSIKYLSFNKVLISEI